MRVYDDLPLSSTEQTVRLLKIRPPNNRNDPILAELFVVSLDKNPEYAALSYHWGPPTSHSQIICNDKVIEIRSNLGLALSSIRSMSTLPLWVDQICINQDDLPERSAQVSFMKRIYSQATETLVYLGEPDSAAKVDACTVLEKLMLPWAKTINWEDGELNGKVLPLRTQLAALKLIAQHPRLAKRSYDRDVTTAISQFIEQQYFCRKWIIQEIAVSRSRFCMVGSYRFEWDWFVLLALKEGQYIFTPRVSNGLQVMWLFQLVRDFAYQQPSSLFKLLYYSRYFKATNPRDHVFALLGAASDSGEFPKPDYESTVEQVYHQTSTCLVRQGGGFLMLHLAGMRPTDNGLPSWVVDWRELDTFHPNKYFASFRAGGGDGSVRLGGGDSLVQVSGKIVDHVVAVGDAFKDKTDLGDKLARYIDNCTLAFEDFYEDRCGSSAIQKDLASLIHFDMRYIPGDALTRSQQGMFDFNEDYYDFARSSDTTALDSLTSRQIALMYHRFYLNKLERHLAKAGQNPFVGCLSRLCQKLRPVETSKRFAEDAIARGIANASVDENMLRYNFFRPTTRPVMTQNRRLGLAPAMTEKGDAVCVVAGAKAPFILRPVGDGTYNIIGEAYVRDIMFGETLIGDACPMEEILIS